VTAAALFWRTGSRELLRDRGCANSVIWNDHDRDERLDSDGGRVGLMVGIVIVAIVVGIVLLLLGVFVEAAKFLLWVGLVILILAIIAGILRYIRRGASNT